MDFFSHFFSASSVGKFSVCADLFNLFALVRYLQPITSLAISHSLPYKSCGAQTISSFKKHQKSAEPKSVPRIFRLCLDFLYRLRQAAGPPDRQLRQPPALAFSRLRACRSSPLLAACRLLLAAYCLAQLVPVLDI